MSEESSAPSDDAIVQHLRAELDKSRRLDREASQVVSEGFVCLLNGGTGPTEEELRASTRATAREKRASAAYLAYLARKSDAAVELARPWLQERP